MVVYQWLMTRRLVWTDENWPLLIFGMPPPAYVLTLAYTPRFYLFSLDTNFRCRYTLAVDRNAFELPFVYNCHDSNTPLVNFVNTKLYRYFSNTCLANGC